MKMIKKLIDQYKSIILYLVFGGFTTLVNIGTYAFCARKLNFSTIISNLFAWFFSVFFAYITNRQWVFNSKASTMKEIVSEILSFFYCRLVTGILDLILMYVFVDSIGVNDFIMKIISNIIVIVLNYIASKVIIFRQKKD